MKFFYTKKHYFLKQHLTPYEETLLTTDHRPRVEKGLGPQVLPNVTKELENVLSCVALQGSGCLEMLTKDTSMTEKLHWNYTPDRKRIWDFGPAKKRQLVSSYTSDYS